ncbi:cyclin-dependent kinase 2-interacting protein-like [Antedon mediterranea]|uniref:cyclin-dependent kinase 2-interacting protein-like n=1 Tax=Antedon mediterranea TaxID=105859 RepID=UPI003AF5E719
MSCRLSKPKELQGSARVIRDHCADWYNHVMKWEELNDAGLETAKEIVNYKLQAQYQTDSNEPVEEVCGQVTEDSMTPRLQELCYDLQKSFDGQGKLVHRMSKLTKHFEATIQLKSDTSLTFQTWPIKYFYETSQKILSMYAKEYSVKQTILENIAHSNNRDLLMMYVSIWQAQPYIEKHAKMLLESMLVETGYR